MEHISKYPLEGETEFSIEKEIREIRVEQKELRQMLTEIIKRLEAIEAREKAPPAVILPEELLKKPDIEKIEKEKSLQEIEQVAVEILDLIEPRGRGSALARLPALIDWLKVNHYGIRAEPIGSMNVNIWLLLVLTSNEQNGVLVPAIDSIIGAGAANFIKGGRYDGTQALYRADILQLGRAKYDEASGTWRPVSNILVSLH